MKNKIIKTLSICVMSGILLRSGSTISSANDFAYKLKNYILLDSHKSNDIYNYNTNNDSKINVLDLCRIKNSIINNNITYRNPVKIMLGYPDVNYQEDVINIPVIINTDLYNISSAQLKIDCDNSCFSLAKIEKGNLDADYSFSSNQNVVQITSKEYSINQQNRELVFLKFKMDPGTTTGTYRFAISQAQLAETGQYQMQRELRNDEYNIDAAVSYVNINITPPETTPATTTVTTLPPETTPATTTVTTLPPETTPATTTVTTEQINDFTPDSETMQIINKINEYRGQKSLNKLIPNEALCNVAAVRARELEVLESTDKRPSGTIDDLLMENGVYTMSVYQIFVAYSDSNYDVANDTIRYGEWGLKKTNYRKIGMAKYQSSNGLLYWFTIITG